MTKWYIILALERRIINMNYIICYIITILFCLINNLILFDDITKKITKRKLKYNFKNKKYKNELIKEIVLLLIPIINLLNSLELDVLYMSSETAFIRELEKKNIIKSMSNWENQNINSKSNIIKIMFKEFMFEKMLSESSKIKLNNGEIIYFVDRKGKIKVLIENGVEYKSNNELIELIEENNNKLEKNKVEKKIINESLSLSKPLQKISFKLVRRKK